LATIYDVVRGGGGGCTGDNDVRWLRGHVILSDVFWKSGKNGVTKNP
jgi:hypothetical protein